jgi:hypothetical protein
MKNEQIEKTVRTEMKSLAEVAKRNISQGKAVPAKTVREI